jgi:alcohol dehydrogenase (cytochrome c)
LNLLYWGVGNPGADWNADNRAGDNLYSDCAIALDPDTGKLKWYFQFTPHDLYDYDAVETPVLVDANFRGEPRKLIVEANRNGFLYVLDRTNGGFLSARPFVEKITWASGIDAKGRPIRTGAQPSKEGTRICPGFVGATNWYSPSYNPGTALFYFVALETCNVSLRKPQEFQTGQTYYSTGARRSEGDHNQKMLLAFALDGDKPVWRYLQAGIGRSAAGTMTTSGGLVFYGDDTQSFEAVDAASGKPLWHFNTGQNISASPMSYAVNSKQFVAIAAGSDVFSFALP